MLLGARLITSRTATVPPTSLPSSPTSAFGDSPPPEDGERVSIDTRGACHEDCQLDGPAEAEAGKMGPERYGEGVGGGRIG